MMAIRRALTCTVLLLLLVVRRLYMNYVYAINIYEGICDKVKSRKSSEIEQNKWNLHRKQRSLLE